MKKTILLCAAALMMFAVVPTACNKKTDDPVTTPTKPPTGTKPSVTTFKFAATGKDCGITDGYANQQHLIPKLVHVNTDKCNGETYRPTITLNFNEAPVAGTYTVSETGKGAKEVKVESIQYNYTSWMGTGGTVEVSVNATDAALVDIEFKSINMRNENAGSDTKNPATDVLTGWIIKI